MIHKLKLENKKTKGFVYNKLYYVLTAILASIKFKDHANKIILMVEKGGLLIPIKISKSHIQIPSLSTIIDEFLSRKIDITELADNILKDFGISETNDLYWNYMEGILNKLVYDQDPIFEASQFPEYKYDDKQNPKELWIKIYPWTTKKIYDSYFPSIVILKSKLENNTHKIKPWETFERDLELYKLYLKVKTELENGVLKDDVITEYRGSTSKSIYERLLQSSEYKDLKKKYHSQLIDDSSVQRVIKDTKIKLDNLQLI